MPLQNRFLGIDYGSRRIGLSISDPLRILASQLETVDNDDSFWHRLREIIFCNDVELIVVGMPLNLKGEKARKGAEVEQFLHRLRREVDIDVVPWDERFTTSIAHRTLLEMGTKRKDRRTNKGRIDAMAAAIMLQSYLDSKKRSESC